VSNIKVTLDKRVLEQIRRSTPQKVGNAVRAAALEGERYVKQSFTTSPSSPGEPPGIDTGALRASIHVETVNANTRAIATSTDYAAYLEFGTSRMSARPYMMPMAIWLQGQLEDIFRGIVD
jgi:phage gpG-like protein